MTYKAIALVLGFLLMPFLGLNGVGEAQSVIEVQGTIESVDCLNGAAVLSAPNGTNTIYVSDSTQVSVNATAVQFCDLEGYVGSEATAWLQPNGSDFEATEIDVTAPAVAVQPASATTDSVVTQYASPVPIWGIVLGTIIVAGLIYLIVHGPDGGYYRYPYYGPYYRYYYAPVYRPYVGYYPPAAPVILAAPPVTGTVIGIVIVNNYQYIVVRDNDDRMSRFPYYGPYHNFYYKSEYHEYKGSDLKAYTEAPVRQGDPHWDGPAATGNHTPIKPNTPEPAQAPRLPAPGSSTHNQPQRQWTPPSQPAPQRQSSPAPQPAQRQWTPPSQPAPQRQPKPASQSTPQRQWTPPSQPAPQRQSSPAPQPAQRQWTPPSQPAPQRQSSPAPQSTPQRQWTSPNQSAPQRQSAPAYRPGPQQQPSPAPQSTPQRQWTPPNQSAPQRQSAPAYRPGPQQQPKPAYQPAPQRQSGPPYQNSGRGNTGGSRAPSQQCGSGPSNQSCPNDGPGPQR